MHILVVGLNHRTAPVEVREKFTLSDEELPEALQQLKQTKSILECVIVGTCNRTEIYVVVDRLHLCGHFIRSFMEQWFNIPNREFSQHLYIHEDQAALEHLFRVTSGLDSMIIGETQIIGQIRSSFLLAQKLRTTGTMFNTLFKQAVTMAKRAHSETTIGENAVSVSYAAVELGKRIFGHFKDKNVMIIGAGKMSELTVKNLYANGVNKVIVANRTLEKAVNLAEKIKGIYCSFEQINDYISDVDIIISSTGASEYILTRDQIQAVMQKRKSRSLFLIDIAVPRDLDPQISDISNVFLYDIDDLEGIVQSNLEQRRMEALKIEKMIEEEIDIFQKWYKTLGVGPVIRALQDKSALIHEETMESLLKKLPELDERQVKVIRKLTKSIVNQMMHDPILRIKEMSAERNGDDALEMFSKFFALEDVLREQEELALAEVKQSNKTRVVPEEKATLITLKTHDLLARS
jgi:glutamyl-tRNA reductase